MGMDLVVEDYHRTISARRNTIQDAVEEDEEETKIDSRPKRRKTGIITRNKTTIGLDDDEM